MVPIVLRSGNSELGIEPATGRIALLRCAEREFIARPASEGILRLHLPLSDFEAQMVSSHRTAPKCAQGADRVTLDFADIQGKRGPTGISARVVIRAVDDAFELSCEIRNGSAGAIPQVFFPYFGGFQQVDGPDDAVMFAKSRFLPWRRFAAQTVDHRMEFMKTMGHPEYSLTVFNTYIAGMKWMDFGGASAGVSLFSKDKTATAQSMYLAAESFFKSPETIDLGWYFYPFIGPGETWRSPGFVLYPHAGDWRRGVLKFKAHADRTFTPVASTPERDATIGQQSLWISWHYQDWRDRRYTFKDIPAVAAEARAAGFHEMTVIRTTELDFCLPHKVRKPLGTSAELKAAVEASRKLGVNIIPFITCHLIREDTIGEDRNPREWYAENAGGQREGDNWTYDPRMTPRLPILQLGSRAAYHMCAGSREWRKAFFQLVEQVSEEWGYTGFMFDQSFETMPLCFNPLHAHKPDQRTQFLNEVLAEARRRLAAKFGPAATLSGEAQWDASTEWMDMTWDWICFEANEPMAPFHMAFPRARQCSKCTDDIPQINRIFTAGYWLDLYLEEGGARLGDYPELTKYLASLAAFKARFSRFFNQRDFYLYDMGARCPADQPLWIRSHRSGDEVLVLVADPAGKARNEEVELELPTLIGRDAATLTVWSRTLEQKASFTSSSPGRVKLAIQANDFMAVHVTSG